MILVITYKNRKIEKICTDAKVAEKTYGKKMAEKIQNRISEIEASITVEIMLQFCHSLSNNRKGQYAVDLINPYRLVFRKIGDEIQIAEIIEIVDYH